MSICDWPVAERPRERLLGLGPGALTDAELLAVMLRNGIAGNRFSTSHATCCPALAAARDCLPQPRPRSAPSAGWGPPRQQN